MTQTQRLVLVIALGAISLALALHSAKRPSRIRPRFDLARLLLQLATAIAVIALTHVAPAAWMGATALALGATLGWVQGRQLDVHLQAGRPMAVRSPLGMAVWVAALIGLQVASALRSAGVLHGGQLIGWVSLGITAGVIFGRSGPLARATERSVPMLTAAAGLLLLVGVALAVGTPSPSGEAHASPRGVTSGQWMRGAPVSGPTDTTAFTTYNHSPGSINAQLTAPDYQATFSATYDVPPEVVEAGATVTLAVNASGSVAGTVQQFTSFDVILFVDDKWTGPGVSVGVNCSKPVGDYPLTCTPPASASGVFTVKFPGYATPDGVFKVGVGEMGTNAITWEYTWQGGGANDPGAGSTDPGSTDGGDGNDEITDDEFDAGSAAGAGAAAATVLISLIETMGSGLPGRRPEDGEGGADGQEHPRSPWAPPTPEMTLEPPSLDSVGPSLADMPPVETVVAATTDSTLLDQLGSILDRLREWPSYLSRPLTQEEIDAYLEATAHLADDPSMAAAQAALDALATLLDRNIMIGPLPGYVVAAMLRNPAMSAEVIVRIAVAAHTGGLSELGLIPVDVWRDITAARDAAIARGELFTFTDGLVAGAQGQAIGWVFDGGGRILGPALGGGSRVGGQLGDTVEDLARARPRAGMIPAGTDDAFLRGLQARDKIPLSRVGSAGYTVEQAAAIQRVAEREGVDVVARTTNIYDGTRQVIPKPELIKSKTVSDLDRYLNPQLRPEDKGLVGLFEPQRPTLPQGHPDYDAAWSRYDKRLHEWQDYSASIRELEDAGVVRVENGVVHHRAADGTLTPFAGDIDLVQISRHGVPVTGDEYERIARELRASAANTQHGAEVNIVRDFIANRTAGLRPGTHQYTAAFQTAEADARALFGTLNQNHLSGRETAIVFSGDGITRAPQLTDLDARMDGVARALPPPPIDDDTISGISRAAGSGLTAEDD